METGGFNGVGSVALHSFPTESAKRNEEPTNSADLTEALQVGAFGTGPSLPLLY